MQRIEIKLSFRKIITQNLIMYLEKIKNKVIVIVTITITNNRRICKIEYLIEKEIIK
jgi:hypothetical protein